MNRALVLAVFVALVTALVDVRPADAGLSRRNPYRSFNISGYNYGSTTWEKKYGKKNYSSSRNSGVIFRRR